MSLSRTDLVAAVELFTPTSYSVERCKCGKHDGRIQAGNAYTLPLEAAAMSSKKTGDSLQYGRTAGLTRYAMLTASEDLDSFRAAEMQFSGVEG